MSPSVQPLLEADGWSSPTCSTVTVKVGTSSTDFIVHEDVLRRSSTFLHTKAKKPWSKSGSQVDIPNHSADAFKMYVSWLYANKIFIEPPAWELEPTRPGSLNASRLNDDWIVLAKSYVLGEELIDAALRDSIMASLRVMPTYARSRLAQSVIAEVVDIIYDGTPDSSIARQFFAILYSESSCKQDLKMKKEHFPADFLFDVLLQKAPNKAA